MSLKERMAEVERLRVEHMLRYHPAEFGAEPRTCEWCEGTYRREPGTGYAEWAQRRFCSRACVGAAVGRPKELTLRRARQAARAAAVIEDVEWLLRTDPDPKSIATRVGFTRREHLFKALHRWERDDLAERLAMAGAAA